MAGSAGKKARVKVATVVGGPYTSVAGIDSISFQIDGQNVDVSEMGDDFMSKVQGMKDVKISCVGNRLLTDTNGQEVVRSAFLNDTALFAQFLPDGGTTANAGSQLAVKVVSFKVDAAQTGKLALSFELECNQGTAPTNV